MAITVKGMEDQREESSARAAAVKESNARAAAVKESSARAAAVRRGVAH